MWPLLSCPLVARCPRPCSKGESLFCAGRAVADSSAADPHPRLQEGRSHSQPRGVPQALGSRGEFADPWKHRAQALLILRRNKEHALWLCTHWAPWEGLQGQTCRCGADACIFYDAFFMCQQLCFSPGGVCNDGTSSNQCIFDWRKGRVVCSGVSRPSCFVLWADNSIPLLHYLTCGRWIMSASAS